MTCLLAPEAQFSIQVQKKKSKNRRSDAPSGTRIWLDDIGTSPIPLVMLYSSQSNAVKANFMNTNEKTSFHSPRGWIVGSVIRAGGCLTGWLLGRWSWEIAWSVDWSVLALTDCLFACCCFCCCCFCCFFFLFLLLLFLLLRCLCCCLWNFLLLLLLFLLLLLLLLLLFFFTLAQTALFCCYFYWWCL